MGLCCLRLFVEPTETKYSHVETLVSGQFVIAAKRRQALVTVRSTELRTQYSVPRTPYFELSERCRFTRGHCILDNTGALSGYSFSRLGS